jgi:hypothetical protein
MKKIISALVIVFCVAFFTHESKAQGNLQFNQVILFDMASGATPTITVPPGKVWKIETASTANGANAGIQIRNSSVQAIALLSTSTTAASYPFWLPSGFSGSFLNSAAVRSCVSIIEFNVVP